ncbi:hypothetical protein [Hyphomonas atlantica]|uniref:Uncharacterized protein n=1 Tax=Hyphomonas atlantica TaxID=1280948 RepID=A0A059E012_9PROT|nr:hypothetical protein [Hyphomonas atlantica]KCZ60301.1 hypothetical protein HY36_17585 [Hyphomonas atlantica]
MAENLNEIWANSRHLSEYYSEIFEDVAIENSALQSHQSSNTENMTNFAMMLDSFNKSMAASVNHNQRHTKAIEQLRNELVGAEIALVGVREHAGAFAIERVEPNFWIGANIRPETNEADLGETRFSKLRIVSTPINENAHAQFHSRRQEILRLEAVRECEKLGRVDLSGGPKSRRNRSNNIQIRTDIYLEYLKDKYPDMDFEAWGYSDSSFERTENAHKKKKYK